MDAAELLSVALAAQNESAPIYSQGLPAWMDASYLNRATSIMTRTVALPPGVEVQLCLADPRRWLLQLVGSDPIAPPTSLRPSFVPPGLIFSAVSGRFFAAFNLFNFGLAVPAAWFAVCANPQSVFVIEHYAT